MPVAIEDLTFDTPQISDLAFEDTPSIDQLRFDNETTNVSQSIPQELTDKQEIDRLTERYRIAKSLTVDPVKAQRLDDEFKRKVAPLMDSRPRTPGALATSQNVNIDELMGKYTQEMPIVVPQDVTTDEPIISEDAALKALKFLRRGSPIDNEYTRGVERSVAKMASGLTTAQGVMATALAPFAPQLIASYFAVEGAKSFGEIAGQTSVDWDSLTPQEQGERAGDLLLSGAIPASLLIHGAMAAREGMAKINTPPVIPKDLPEQIESIAPQTAEALKANLADLTPSEETKSAEPTKVEPAPAPAPPDLTGQPPPPVAEKAASEAAKAEAEKKQTEIIGMGGAVPSELAGQPTIGELIPPRVGESPDPPARAQPPSVGVWQKIKDLWGEATSEPIRKIKAELGAWAGKTMPRTTSLSREAGEAGARYLSARVSAQPQATLFSHDVLAGLEIDPVKLGAALSEDNLRSVKEQHLKNASDAKLSPEKQANAQDQADRVFSFIGEDKPFKTEQAYQDYLNRPEVKEAISRHKSDWEAVIDPMYRKAMLLDTDLELPPRGLQTGARVNLAAIREGEPVPPGSVWAAPKGGLLNTLQRKSPFGVRAKGTGEAYSPNYIDLMENTFNKQLEIAKKNEFDESLVKSGLAVTGEPGLKPELGGEQTVAFPLKRKTIIIPGEGAFSQNKMIYVRKSLEGEYRRAANLDYNPYQRWLLTRVNNALNQTALAGLTDVTVHVTNLTTALAQLPVSKMSLLNDALLSAAGRLDIPFAVAKAATKGTPNLARAALQKSKLLKAITPDVMVKSIEDAFWKNQNQIASLAEIGAMKEHSPSTGIVGMRHASDLIKWYDQTVRLVLDDAYQDMARRGLVENSQTARREFINQVGQYNKRAQGYIISRARDLGTGPFVTAGRTFNALAVRSALLDPGVKASSLENAFKFRVNALSKWTGALAFVALANYLTTGKTTGRTGTPIGSIDTGQNDKQGRMQSFSVVNLTGQGRALRVTGIRGFAEAKMKGLPSKVAADSAYRDVVNAWTAPFAGPPVKAAAVALTGFPPAVNVGRVSKVVPPGEMQSLENVKEAGIQANPLVAGISKAMEPGRTWKDAVASQLPRFTLQAKQPEAMIENYPAIVRRAQANAYMEDVIHRARYMEDETERSAYINEALSKLAPEDQEHARLVLRFRMIKF